MYSHLLKPAARTVPKLCPHHQTRSCPTDPNSCLQRKGKEDTTSIWASCCKVPKGREEPMKVPNTEFAGSH